MTNSCHENNDAPENSEGTQIVNKTENSDFSISLSDILNNAYPEHIAKETVDTEFLEILDTWFKERFCDESVIEERRSQIKVSKEIDQERMQQFTKYLNAKYQIHTYDEKEVVFMEIMNTYNFWMLDRLDREYLRSISKSTEASEKKIIEYDITYEKQNEEESPVEIKTSSEKNDRNIANTLNKKAKKKSTYRRKKM